MTLFVVRHLQTNQSEKCFFLEQQLHTSSTSMYSVSHLERIGFINMLGNNKMDGRMRKIIMNPGTRICTVWFGTNMSGTCQVWFNQTSSFSLVIIPNSEVNDIKLTSPHISIYTSVLEPRLSPSCISDRAEGGKHWVGHIHKCFTINCYKQNHSTLVRHCWSISVRNFVS